jgi:hypothetical protein
MTRHEYTIRVRLVVGALIRVCALGLIVGGLIGLGRVVFARMGVLTFGSSSSSTWMAFKEVLRPNGFVWEFVVVLGVLVWVLCPWLSRTIVGFPGGACGRCGHEEVDGGGVCVECGARG